MHICMCRCAVFHASVRDCICAAPDLCPTALNHVICIYESAKQTDRMIGGKVVRRAIERAHESTGELDGCMKGEYRNKASQTSFSAECGCAHSANYSCCSTTCKSILPVIAINREMFFRLRNSDSGVSRSRSLRHAGIVFGRRRVLELLYSNQALGRGYVAANS